MVGGGDAEPVHRSFRSPQTMASAAGLKAKAFGNETALEEATGLMRRESDISKGSIA